MARSFLDTSALVKYYHPEEGTGEVTQFVEVREGPWRVRQDGKKRVRPYRVFACSRGGEGEAVLAGDTSRACWAALITVSATPAKNINPWMPLATGAEVLLRRTEAASGGRRHDRGLPL